MLPSPNRMTRASDFGSVVRSGRRARSGTVIVHHLSVTTRSLGAASDGPVFSDAPDAGVRPSPRVGFVVSRAVGNSVVRHRTTRRLRETVRPMLATLPSGSATVIRALPGAGEADFDRLAGDVGAACARLGL